MFRNEGFVDYKMIVDLVADRIDFVADRIDFVVVDMGIFVVVEDNYFVD